MLQKRSEGSGSPESFHFKREFFSLLLRFSLFLLLLNLEIQNKSKNFTYADGTEDDEDFGVFPAQEEGELSELWQIYPLGSLVNAMVIAAPSSFLIMNPDATEVEGFVENTYQFAESFRASERHLYLDPGQVVRVEVLPNGYGRILPENSVNNPYNNDSARPTIVELKYLEPIESQRLESFSVYEDTKPVDKLIVVLDNGYAPELIAYEGSRIVLKVPVVLGPTPQGDFRIWRKRMSDNMPGIPGVPFSQCFSGGYCAHGSPWWNWAELTQGHYGSHGCVNLPDDEWYRLNLRGQSVSVDEWLFAWTNTNLSLDGSDPYQEEAALSSEDPGWYTGDKSVRFLVVSSLDELNNYPATARLGGPATESQITDFAPLQESFAAQDSVWVLSHIGEEGELEQQQIVHGSSPALDSGESLSSTWVMLHCDGSVPYDQPAAVGASRTVGEMCYHFAVERPGSICTPERVDEAYFGERVYCLEDRFNSIPGEIAFPLIEHEETHLIQFRSPLIPVFQSQGIALDDQSPGEIEYQQSSIGGVLEFGAQVQNQDTVLESFYSFVLAGYNRNGQVVLINSNATMDEVWEYLHGLAGDETGQNEEIRGILTNAFLLNPEAYEQATQMLGAPLHVLVPDYSRISR